MFPNAQQHSHCRDVLTSIATKTSQRIWRTMDSIINDIRYGVRSLLKQPGFTAIAIITLALGIGANTAIFSVVNGVLLRSLPYPHAEQMVYVLEGRVSDPKFEGSYSPQNFTEMRSRNHSFEYCSALYFVSRSEER